MTIIWAIAYNTFREAVRNKIFYTLLFFAVIASAFSVSLSTLIVGDFSRIIVNLGLANINLFGTLIAIFVGISLVYKEIEKRTIYAILAKPIHRHHFILGKYLGLSLTLLVEVAIMAAILFVLLLIWGTWTIALWAMAGVAMIFLQLLLITAVAVLFSAVSTPILSGMFTLGFYVIGHTSSYLVQLLGPDPNPAAVQAIDIIRSVLPDFTMLDFNGIVLYQRAVGLWPYLNGALYGLSYTVAVLLLAVLSFERRDLK